MLDGHPRRIGERGDGGRFQSRGDRGRRVEHGTRTVIVEHQVLLAENHALHAPRQLVTGGCVLVIGVLTFDEHGLRIAQRVAEWHQVVQSERATRSDDVGDGVGHAELDRDLHRAVEPDDRRLNPSGGQVFSHQVGKRGGDSLSREIFHAPLSALWRRVAERRRSEPEGEPLAYGCVGFPRQITAGDSEVQLPRTDVDRNVFGPQEEELHVVDRVDDRQVLGVGTAPVPGLGQDLGGRLGQRPLIGDGDAQDAVHSLE